MSFLCFLNFTLSRNILLVFLILHSSYSFSKNVHIDIEGDVQTVSAIAKKSKNKIAQKDLVSSSLKELEIEFDDLLKVLRKNFGLTVISITRYSYSPMNINFLKTREIKNLIYALEKHAGLTSLSLNSAIEVNTECFGEILSRLKFLRKLSIASKSPKLSAEELYCLGERSGHLEVFHAWATEVKGFEDQEWGSSSSPGSRTVYFLNVQKLKRN